MSQLNVEAALEVLEELITEQGEVAFSHWSEGGGPGCGGVDQIYKLGGYYFIRREDSPYEGPYDDFDTALDQLVNPLFIDRSTGGVTCTEMSTEELATRLTWWPDDDDDPNAVIEHPLLLNGEKWVVRYEDGGTSLTRA